jgi:hypothetical protein
MLKEQGAKKLFSHPFLCTGLAALSRLGFRSRGNVEVDATTKAVVVDFELVWSPPAYPNCPKAGIWGRYKRGS